MLARARTRAGAAVSERCRSVLPRNCDGSSPMLLDLVNSRLPLEPRTPKPWRGGARTVMQAPKPRVAARAARPSQAPHLMATVFAPLWQTLTTINFVLPRASRSLRMVTTWLLITITTDFKGVRVMEAGLARPWLAATDAERTTINFVMFGVFRCRLMMIMLSPTLVTTEFKGV